MKLSDRVVANLTAPEKGQKLYLDDTPGLTGFGVRVGTNSRAFVLTMGTDRKRVTLGRYPLMSLSQARDAARTLLARRQLKLDQHKPSPLFKDMLREYLAEREGETRRLTQRRDRRVFKLFSPLSDLPLEGITPERVQAIIDRQKAPTSRHTCSILFKAFVTYAKRRGHMETWPVHRIWAPSPDHTPRDRVLTDDELRRVLLTAEAWEAAGNDLGTIIRLLILTGQRRQQIGGLMRSEVDFDKGLLVWQPERMKAGRRHAIPMSPTVRAILESRSPNRYYFPNGNGDPFNSWSRWHAEFLRDVGFSDFCMHDFRRVLATQMQKFGVKIEVTERILSHRAITGGLVGVYQKYDYLTEMREALKLYDEWVCSLTNDAR